MTFSIFFIPLAIGVLLLLGFTLKKLISGFLIDRKINPAYSRHESCAAPVMMFAPIKSLGRRQRLTRSSSATRINADPAGTVLPYAMRAIDMVTTPGTGSLYFINQVYFGIL